MSARPSRASSTVGGSGRRIPATVRSLPVSGLLALLLFAVVPLLTASSAAAADCPNQAIRDQQGMTGLPECMALEMVSPPGKDNLSATTPSIGVGDNNVKFLSRAALGDTPGVTVSLGDQYIASRGPDGWATTAVAAPGPYGRDDQIATFSSTYDSWFQLSDTETQRGLGQLTQFDSGLGRGTTVRDPLLDPYNPVTRNNGIVQNRAAMGASADMTHQFFQPGGIANGAQTRYFPDDPVPFQNSAKVSANTYVSVLDPDGQARLELLSRDVSGQVWGQDCGTYVGGGAKGSLNQGAISADGKLVYFTTRAAEPVNGGCPASAPALRVMRRVEASDGVHIAQLVSSECTRIAPACNTTDGDDNFQAASADGTKVFFTTNRQLTNTDLDTGATCTAAAPTGCDLYMFDSTLPPGHRLIQVSAGDSTDATPGTGAKVMESIPAVSGDGSHVYFVAQGVLTTSPNPNGVTATAGQPNLYMYERDSAFPTGRTTFIAKLAAGTDGDLFGVDRPAVANGAMAVPFYGKDAAGNEVGGDGHVFVFKSKAAVTADDTDGSQIDVFRYDAAAGTLTRISKPVNPGGHDNGAFGVDVGRLATGILGPNFAEANRWVSDDGNSIVFSTPEGLVDGQDDPNAPVVLWHDGQLSKLPGDATPGRFVGNTRALENPTISSSGNVVAFGSTVPLLPQDGDIARDIYVARVDGGFPDQPPALPCDALSSACQGPGSPPIDSPIQSGGVPAGNVTPSQPATLKVAALTVSQRAALAAGKSAALTVTVNLPGAVAASGVANVGKKATTVLSAHVSATKAGALSVPLKLSAAGRRELSRTHKLSVSLTVLYSRASEQSKSTLVLTTKSSKSKSKNTSTSKSKSKAKVKRRSARAAGGGRS